MKKRKIIIIAAVVLALILFLPIPGIPYDDGGTREYTAKIVDWRKIGSPHKTSVYWFPDNFKSVSELWDMDHPVN